MTWAEYYNKFYDWAQSTRISRMSSITDFGPSAEVCEIAEALLDDKLAQRLVTKALDGGVRFKAEEIMDLSLLMDRATLTKMVATSADALNEEQLEELYSLIDDDVFERASHRAGITIFQDDIAGEDAKEVYQKGTAGESEPPKVGFFTALLLGIGAVKHLGKKSSRKHDGKCNGDCANCPPHYGYRHGRWYYGHHHSHGCEFGGNGGL